MATIALPSNAIPKRIVKGTTIAARDLTDVVAAAADTVEICELPEGAVVIEVGVTASADPGNLLMGIAGADIVDDPNFFLDTAASGTDTTVKANLRLGYQAATAGEVVTFDTSIGILEATTGRAWAVYTMDADVA